MRKGGAGRLLIRRAIVGLLTCGLLLPLIANAHPAFDTDPDCRTVLAPARAGAPSIDARRQPTTHPEHCVACHWLRTLASASPAATAVVLPASAGRSRDRLPAVTVASRDGRGETAPRGPPTSSIV